MGIEVLNFSFLPDLRTLNLCWTTTMRPALLPACLVLLVSVVSFSQAMPDIAKRIEGSLKQDAEENDLEEKRGIFNDIDKFFREDFANAFWSKDEENAKRNDGAMKQNEEENDPEEKRGIIHDIPDDFGFCAKCWIPSEKKDNEKRNDEAMKQDDEENDLEKKRGIFNDIASWFSEDKDDLAKRNFKGQRKHEIHGKGKGHKKGKGHRKNKGHRQGKPHKKSKAHHKGE